MRRPVAGWELTVRYQLHSMMNALTRLLKQLSGWNTLPQRPLQSIASTEPPQSPITQISIGSLKQAAEISPKLVFHEPLLNAITKFERANLPASQIVFHGCATDARDTDHSTRRLFGTRKWFSSNAAYAVDYAGTYGGGCDGGMLWICQIDRSIPTLIGSQASLKSASPWLPQQFPSKMPSEFERYAQRIFNESGSVALLGHCVADHFEEILRKH